MSRRKGSSFDKIVSKLKSLGFDVRVEKRIEEEDGEKYTVREAYGRKDVYGYNVIAYVEETDGEVETIRFEVSQLPLIRFYARKNTVNEVEELFNRVKQAIKETVDRKKKFATIIEELKRMGFEVYEHFSYAEAYYRVSAVNYARIVLNFEPERPEDGVLTIQISLNAEKTIDLAKKTVEILNMVRGNE